MRHEVQQSRPARGLRVHARDLGDDAAGGGRATAVTASEFIEAARSYLGCPFHHQGRVRDGIDCIGILVCAARDCGLVVPDRTDYPKRPCATWTLEEELDARLIRTDKRFARLPGAISSFWMRHPERSYHAGLATEKGLLHTYASVGRVVETQSNEVWWERVSATWIIPDVRYDSWQPSP